MTENEYMNGLLGEHNSNTEPDEEPMFCQFCGEAVDELVMVTDMDGDRWPMCRECLNNDDESPACLRCGSEKEPVRCMNQTLICPDCGYTATEGDYYQVPYTVKRTREKLKKHLRLRKRLASIIRKEFDSYGNGAAPHQMEELRGLIELAEEVRIGNIVLSLDVIREMKSDLL